MLFWYAIIIIILLFVKYFPLEEFLDKQYTFFIESGLDIEVWLVVKFELTGTNTNPTKDNTHPAANGTVLLSHVAFYTGGADTEIKYLSGDKFPVAIIYNGAFNPILIWDPQRSDYGKPDSLTDTNYTYLIRPSFIGGYLISQYEPQLDYLTMKWKSFPGKFGSAFFLGTGNYDLNKITVYDYTKKLKPVYDVNHKIVGYLLPSIKSYF